MIIFIKGPNERKRVDIGPHDKINKKVQEIFEIDTFSLSLDENNTNPIDGNKNISELGITKGTTIHLHYDVIKKDVKREKDKFMCDHDTNAMCANCAPLDPWDEKYYLEKKIKYLSYGSYLEMCKYKNTDVIMEDYSVKKCTDHKNNIKCVNCQDKDIFLNPQRYRMVDHVEFDDSAMVENFIKHWRDNRRQYLGILIGKYKPYDIVPLGCKAVISGIWFPEQENYPDGFILNESLDSDFLIDSGLEIVGMIYSDLIFEGHITSKKIKEDFILSSLEVDFISKMQFLFPNFVNNKLFNSKFVTIVVTANEYNEIELKEYQVSSQCMALTRNRLILPTEDPQKFYTSKNLIYKTIEKDNSLKTLQSDPFFPPEYFIVRLTHGNKQQPLFLSSTFVSNTFTQKKMAEYFDETYSLEKFSNFSLLMKIKNKIKNFNKLLKCIIENDKQYFDEFTKSEDFKELIVPLQKFYKRAWTCKACTFYNEHKLDACEICETPNIE